MRRIFTKQKIWSVFLPRQNQVLFFIAIQNLLIPSKAPFRYLSFALGTRDHTRASTSHLVQVGVFPEQRTPSWVSLIRTQFSASADFKKSGNPFSVKVSIPRPYCLHYPPIRTPNQGSTEIH